MKSIILRSASYFALFASAVSISASNSANGQPAANPATPVVAEPLDIKSFTLATDAEVADFSQLFAVVYPRLVAKPAVAVTPKTPAVAPRAPRMTLLARSRTVVFRGTKAELDIAESIVKMLQGTSHDEKGLHIVKLKTARADEIVASLAALELADRVIALRNSNSIVMIPGSDADNQQVKKVMEMIDKVEPKPVAKIETKIDRKVAPKNDD